MLALNTYFTSRRWVKTKI